MGGALISLMSLCANHRRLFTIDELYTFGVPGVSLHQLNNSLSTDGCFKGSRVYNMDTEFDDPIPVLSGELHFKHPKLRELRIKQMSDGSYVTKPHDCNSSHAMDPFVLGSDGSDPWAPEFFGICRSSEGNGAYKVYIVMENRVLTGSLPSASHIQSFILR